MTAPDVTTPSGDGREALRERIADALLGSRLTWGTHADQWNNDEWQRRFWREAADIVLAALPAPDPEAAAPQDEVERLRAEVDNWRLAQKATLTANRRLAARLAAAEAQVARVRALCDSTDGYVADLRSVDLHPEALAFLLGGFSALVKRLRAALGPEAGGE